MNEKKSNYKKIVIVGGGSAGWMSAAFLSNVLDITSNPNVNITLIESSSSPAIGVGEATIHTLRSFLQTLNIPEGEFLFETGATLKHGILFQDWCYGPDNQSQNNKYFHPFEAVPSIAPEGLSSHWINASEKGINSERYDRWVGVQGLLAAAGKSPKLHTSDDYEAPVPYGYHLDAVKYADYLKKYSKRLGVNHIVAHIKDVLISPSEGISGVKLENGETITGDLFIDCSGFSSILMGKLNNTFLDYSDYLFCDKAVTARQPFDAKTHSPKPYTTATARESGWTFEIELTSRRGVGYSYSSKHITPEKAEQALAQFYHLDADTKFNHISTRVGRHTKSWEKNCIAIGLSYGFLEPLESTGIYFIEMALRFLADYITFDDNQIFRDRYNELNGSIFDKVMEFIVLHYILTEREDTPFWQDVKNKTKPLPDLEKALEMWKFKAPSEGDFVGAAPVFNHENYSAILFGMNHKLNHVPFGISMTSAETSMEYFSMMQQMQKAAIKGSPSHRDFLMKSNATFK